MLRRLLRIPDPPRPSAPARPYKLHEWTTQDVCDALLFMAGTMEAQRQFARADMLREAARRLRKDSAR